MAEKIAVFIQDKFKKDSSTTTLKVIVFEQSSESWCQIEETYVNIPQDMNVGLLREEVKKLIARLADCRIAVGPQLSGIIYGELNRHGFSIFETQDFTPDTLDGILRDLDEGQTAVADLTYVPKRPVETETPGVYQLDLMKLQAANPEISSKQALRGFLDATPFYELRLICAHIPPWLESGPYDINSTPAGDTMIAAVRKKQCKGG